MRWNRRCTPAHWCRERIDPSPRVHLVAGELPASTDVAEFLHQLAIVIRGRAIARIALQPFPERGIESRLLLPGPRAGALDQIRIGAQCNVFHLPHGFSVHELRVHLLRQKLLRLPQKHLQLIVMHPVPRVIHLHHAVILDDVGLPARFRVRRPALFAPVQQRRAGDAGHHFLRVFDVVAIRDKRAHVIVELPGDGSVGVPVGAVQRQMRGHFVREKRIRFLHPRDRRFQRRIVVRSPVFGLADHLDPIAQTLRRGLRLAMRHRHADAFNRDDLLHAVRIHARIEQADHASQRVSDDRHRESFDNIGQRRKIQHMFGDAIQRARRPRAISMAAQIQRVDVIIVAQRARHPIPVARMVQAAVNQDQRRLALRAPIPELKLQAVRIEKMRDRFHVQYSDRNTSK